MNKILLTQRLDYHTHGCQRLNLSPTNTIVLGPENWLVNDG